MKRNPQPDGPSPRPAAGIAPGGPINLLVTLDAGYLRPLQVMLASVLSSNPGEQFHVYLLHSSLTEEDLSPVRALLGPRHALFPIPVAPGSLAGAPTTDRYPVEMYYRIFAAQYLPSELERVLYLDPDLVVRGSLRALYETGLDGALLAAASHVGKMITHVNSFRLDAEHAAFYINSGVMLLHLSALRQVQREETVYRYIETHRSRLLLPDQDIISALYGPAILPLDPYRYNMTERLFRLRSVSEPWLTLDWIRENTVILHYCGCNKPWKEGYLGVLDQFYHQAEHTAGL